MITRKLIFLIGLLGLVLVNLPGAAAEDAEVIFTFGKIETLQVGEQEWRFLEKGVTLTADDLVRMPPFSLIRLKMGAGTSLPTLSGGREVSVSTLIDDGVHHKHTKKGKRINENLEGIPATDVLPLGNQPQAEDRTPAHDQMVAIKVNQPGLENLRRKLDSCPDEITSLISHLVPQQRIPAALKDAINARYPGPNLDLAQKLYRKLDDIALESLNVPQPLLYVQLLRHVGLDADLDVNKKGDLLVIFDSGIPANSTKWIAANQRLIHKRQGKDTIWIRVQIQSPQQSFTTGWYKGSRK